MSSFPPPLAPPTHAASWSAWTKSGLVLLVIVSFPPVPEVWPLNDWLTPTQPTQPRIVSSPPSPEDSPPARLSLVVRSALVMRSSPPLPEAFPLVRSCRPRPGRRRRGRRSACRCRRHRLRPGRGEEVAPDLVVAAAAVERVVASDLDEEVRAAVAAHHVVEGLAVEEIVPASSTTTSFPGPPLSVSSPGVPTIVAVCPGRWEAARPGSPVPQRDQPRVRPRTERASRSSVTGVVVSV